MSYFIYNITGSVVVFNLLPQTKKYIVIELREMQLSMQYIDRS